MAKKIIIYKGDNKNTRHAKKRFKRTLKSKRKNHFSFSKPADKNKDESELEKSRRKNLRKQNKKKRKQYKQSRVEYSPEFQEFCDINRLHEWNAPNRLIKLGADFSFYKDPARVLTSLLSILYHAKTKSDKIQLDYNGGVSFGALYFIDTMCWQVAQARNWRVKHNFPPKITRVLHNLKSNKDSNTSNADSHFINNRIRINREDDSLAKQNHKKKSKEIRDMIIKCVQETNSDFDLSLEQHHAIDSAISEHFDNILLHVPNADYGFLCGYFDREKSELTILIYNFGKSISDTLSREDLPLDMKDNIDKVITNHTRKRFFSIIESKFTQENALTLLALQEGISSKLSSDISRGHGLIDFIDRCFALSSDAKIMIISGKTAIKIDTSYKIGNETVFGRSRKIIAFNQENDIFEKPDAKNVFTLPVEFNGTIIETTIPLKLHSL